MSGDESSATLTISSGLHAGASCILPDRPLTIGADLSADIVLHDEGIAPVHLVIEPDGSDLRVVVRAPGVVIENTKLEQDETVLSALPVSFMIGAVEFRCDAAAANTVVAPSDPADRVVVRSFAALLPQTVRGRAVSAALFGMLVVGIITLRVLTGGGTPARATSSAALSHDDRITSMPTAAELRRSTSEELTLLGLDGVSLSVGSGILTASGRVAPTDATKLHDLELWFDRRFGESAVLLLQVSVGSPENLTVQLQSVWKGPHPNIVVAGQRYVEGSALPDGSVVKQITDRAILFRRNGQSFSLEY